MLLKDPSGKSLLMMFLELLRLFPLLLDLVKDCSRDLFLEDRLSFDPLKCLAFDDLPSFDALNIKEEDKSLLSSVCKIPNG